MAGMKTLKLPTWFDSRIPLQFHGGCTLVRCDLSQGFRGRIVTRSRYRYTGVAEWFSGRLQSGDNVGSIPASRATSNPRPPIQDMGRAPDVRLSCEDEPDRRHCVRPF